MPRMQKKVHGSRRRPAKASRSASRDNHGISGWYWGTYKIYLKLKTLNEIPTVPEPEPVFVHGKNAYVVWFQIDTKDKLRIRKPVLQKMKLSDYVLEGKIC